MQDNTLAELPSLTSHLRLITLLLDSNHIKQLNFAGSSSSSGASKQPEPVQHCLQELSLANNQLTSLQLSYRDTSRHLTPQSSTLQLASWLVCLQVLRLPGNQLRDLAGLQGCSSLRQLDVSRNKLTCLLVRGLVVLAMQCLLML
jgi:Leucine-rich repeat (LRR) protein